MSDRPLLRKLIDAVHELQDYALPPHIRAAKALDTRTGEIALYKAGKRNPNCWLAGVDLTCIPTHKKNGCAITSKHVLYARHWPYNVGDTITFVDLNSQQITRKIVKLHAPVPDNDIGIATLDAQLPATITPAARLPADYATLFRVTQDNQFRNAVPCVYSNQKQEILRGRFSSAANDKIAAAPAIEPEYSWASRPVVAGDSGSPSLLVLPRQRQPILLGCWTFAGQSPNVAAHWREIAKVTWFDGGEMQTEAAI